MRVISGSAKGRRLKSLEGKDVRPTTDKVKESVFNIIQFHIEGRRFLDLFSGSGQMGVEALSRGAKQAVFVDKSAAALKVIKANIEAAGLSEGARVINSDALSFLNSNCEKFDVAFLDPPYGAGILQSVLPYLSDNMNKGGLIICESPLKEELFEKIGDFTLDRNYALEASIP